MSGIRLKSEKLSKPTKSSGNVFEDMGFPSEEAAVLQAKIDLKVAIEREAEKQNLSRKRLAQALDIQQPQVSDLLTGKVSKMTVDKLIKYANRLGIRVGVHCK